jgi:hypothetical protein
MTAPHFHTAKEVVEAIKNIGHNDRTGYDGATEGAPTKIDGGSIKNRTTETVGVQPRHKGEDWASERHMPLEAKSTGKK